MKRLFAILSIGIISLGLVACGSNGQEQSSDIVQNENVSDSSEKETEEIPAAKTASPGESFETGSFGLRLESISKASDQNGSEFVTLHFSFTNNESYPTDFMNNILVEAFQGDTSLSATPDMGDMAKQNYMTEATPGETVEDVTLSFYTVDESELKIEVQAASELGLSEPVSITTEMPK